MYRIVFLLLCSITLTNCEFESKNTTRLPYYNEPDFTPIFLENPSEVVHRIPHKIAGFTFFNQDSLIIDSTYIDGKIHVANFIFTSCGSICPTMTSHLKLVDTAFIDLSDEIVFLSFSVTPWLDTPTILKKYKEANSIQNPNWHFLTGSKTEIYELARKSYFAEEDIGFNKDSSEFLHTEHIILVDRNRRIRGIYNGTLRLEMEQLTSDIHHLLSEHL
ncbi:MAG: SCO family protein [Spirosomataceae bacterium]